AVGADQRQELAGIEGEGDVCDGLHATERLVQPLDLQNRRHAPFVHEGGSHQRRASALRPPTRPCGNSSTISRITAPSTARQNSVRRGTPSRRQARSAPPPPA